MWRQSLQLSRSAVGPFRNFVLLFPRVYPFHGFMRQREGLCSPLPTEWGAWAKAICPIIDVFGPKPLSNAAHTASLETDLDEVCKKNYLLQSKLDFSNEMIILESQCKRAAAKQMKSYSPSVVK